MARPFRGTAPGLFKGFRGLGLGAFTGVGLNMISLEKKIVALNSYIILMKPYIEITYFWDPGECSQG